jgi:hypothetical protein
MGCASSTPVKDEEYRDQTKQEFDRQHKIPEAVQQALQGGAVPAKPKNEADKVADRDARRGVSFAGDVRDTPSKPRSPPGADDDSLARAVSITRPRCAESSTNCRLQALLWLLAHTYLPLPQ